jgi:transcriptional regulator with XRE-family HTH domain
VYTSEYEAFLKALVSARRAAGLTQQQLAARLGKPQSFVSKYERRDRRLDLVEFVTIATILGIDPTAIVREMAARISERPKRKAAR